MDTATAPTSATTANSTDNHHSPRMPTFAHVLLWLARARFHRDVEASCQPETTATTSAAKTSTFGISANAITDSTETATSTKTNANVSSTEIASTAMGSNSTGSPDSAVLSLGTALSAIASEVIHPWLAAGAPPALVSKEPPSALWETLETEVLGKPWGIPAATMSSAVVFVPVESDLDAFRRDHLYCATMDRAFREREAQLRELFMRLVHG